MNVQVLYKCIWVFPMVEYICSLSVLSDTLLDIQIAAYDNSYHPFSISILLM